MLAKIKKSIVLKNFGYVSLGGVLAQLLNLIALIYIAKKLTPSDYGLYTFLTVQGMLLYALGDIGSRNIVIRAIARDQLCTNDMVQNGVLLRIITITIFSSVYILYNFLFGHLTPTQITLIFIYSFTNCTATLLESVFWGNQKMLTPAIVNVTTSCLFLAVVFLLPAKSIFVEELFGIYIITNNLLTALTYFIILKSNKLLIGVKSKFWLFAKNITAKSWPYFILMLLGLPYNYLTNNFLDINSNKVQLAYFNLTQKFVSPVNIIIAFSLSSVFPYFSKLWTDDDLKLKQFVYYGLRTFFIGTLMLCFIYTLFAKEIVTLLFGAKYLPTVAISKAQIWFVFLMGINSFIGTIWGATDNEKLLVKSSVVNIIISGPLLYWGSLYGALGLAYAYVGSFAIFEIYLWLDFKRSLKVKVSQDTLLWLLCIFTFVSSNFLLNRLPILLEATMVMLILAFMSAYLYKSAKHLLQL